VRAYHVVPISGLADIIDAGVLDAGAGATALLSDLGKELRSTAEVGDGRSVASFVAFSLSPDSTRWSQLRAGASEPTWSATARSIAPTDYAVLVTTLGALGEPVLTDGDAAGTWTRFARSADEVHRMLGRLHDSDELRADAEALAPSPVSLDVLTLIGVANEPAKERVRALVSAMTRAPRVAVYPPWFAVD
jgi:hypothetical protein